MFEIQGVLYGGWLRTYYDANSALGILLMRQSKEVLGAQNGSARRCPESKALIAAKDARSHIT